MARAGQGQEEGQEEGQNQAGQNQQDRTMNKTGQTRTEQI